MKLIIKFAVMWTCVHVVSYMADGK